MVAEKYGGSLTFRQYRYELSRGIDFMRGKVATQGGLMDFASLLLELKNYWGDVDKLTFTVALLACFVAWRTWRTQHSHNRLSVIPLPAIQLHYGPARISITLTNDGSGPLRVLSFRFISPDGRALENASSIVTVSETEIHTCVDGRSIGPGKDCLILEVLESPTQKSSELDVAAQELSTYRAVLVYTDVYGTKFQALSRELSWFTKEP